MRGSDPYCTLSGGGRMRKAGRETIRKLWWLLLLGLEGKEFMQRLQSPEAREAFMAFAQRRAPNFTQFA